MRVVCMALCTGGISVVVDEPRKIYRSVRNRSLGGVCSGIAEYLRVDPVVVRAVTVVVAIPTGIVPMSLAYLLLWILIPPSPY